MSYLCIDIGGTYMKYGLLQENGFIEKEWKLKTPETIEEFQALNKQEIDRVADYVEGIAISCPGKIDSTKGYVYTCGTIMYLYDFDMASWIKSITLLPFSVINDGKAAVLAEWQFGNLKGTTNSLGMILGTGVGGGLILNNSLYQGKNFQAGEFSFCIEDTPTTGLTIYGSSGSAVTFIKKATAILGVDDDDYQAVFDAIEMKKNPQLTTLFLSYCRSIAKFIVNLQAILDIEKVVIGGGISQQAILIENIELAYNNLFEELEILDQTFERIDIAPCYYNNSSNLIGALQNLLNQKGLSL